MLLLFPKQLLLKLIQQQPTLPHHHLTMLYAQNKRKYLHIFGQVNIGEIRLQYRGQIHKLKPHKLLEILAD